MLWQRPRGGATQLHHDPRQVALLGDEFAGHMGLAVGTGIPITERTMTIANAPSVHHESTYICV